MALGGALGAYKLFDNKAYVSGGMYVVLSVSCCILGIVLGKKLVAIGGADKILDTLTP